MTQVVRGRRDARTGADLDQVRAAGGHLAHALCLASFHRQLCCKRPDFDICRRFLDHANQDLRRRIALGAALDPSQRDALAQIRRWLSYMPGSAWARPETRPAIDGRRATPELLDIVPRNPRQGYDMTTVIDVVADTDTWFEVQPRFGPSMLTGFARLAGQPVAIVANQPAHIAGTIDVDAADKAAHFLQVADAFHLPIVLLTDNPGVLAGSASERAGILRHAGRMFAVQHAVTVPKIQLTLRKAYGFGSTAMGMNPFDNQTLNLAYPGVTFGAMPATATRPDRNSSQKVTKIAAKTAPRVRICDRKRLSS